MDGRVERRELVVPFEKHASVPLESTTRSVTPTPVECSLT